MSAEKIDAFLVVDKPKDMSSQQAVSRLRRALRADKAGHTGTLDPLATGVLPVALGEATKAIPFLDEARKVYRVLARLGSATDTYDAEGKVTQQGLVEAWDQDFLCGQLRTFLGRREQHPPPFSAVKVRGRPAYAMARRGESPELPARMIELEELKIESYDPPDLLLCVTCSKGTYIRSLVHDFGIRLGCFAHVAELRRLQSGPFSLDQARPLSAFLETPDLSRQVLQSIESCLRHLPSIALESEEEARRVISGVPLRRIQQVLENNQFLNTKVALIHRKQIVAVIQGSAEGDFRYQRVLHRSEEAI